MSTFDATRPQSDDCAALDRLARMTWAVVGLAAAFVLAVPEASGFSVQWITFVMPALVCGLLLAVGWHYRRRRPDPRLALALTCTAELMAFAAVAAPLSYLAAAAATNVPLRDPWLDAVDHMLGLDWKALLAWMNSHPALHPIFLYAYSSLMPQAAIVVLALAFAGRLLWLRVFMLSFVFAVLATIALSAVLPAEGAWGFYGITADQYSAISPATRDVHLPIFHGLRNGSFRLLIATGSDGIITFPSLHAALVLILAAGLWPAPVLRWIGLALNAFMLVSIPIDGGHYFSDILAGLGIAAISLAAARAAAGAFNRPPQPNVGLLGLATSK